MSKWHRDNAREWLRRRKKVLKQEPLCRMCRQQGLTVGSESVDHIIPVSQGGSNDYDNLQALCKPCHDLKTRAEKYKPKIGRDGWPLEDDDREAALEYAARMLIIEEEGGGKSVHV